MLTAVLAAVLVGLPGSAAAASDVGIRAIEAKYAAMGGESGSLGANTRSTGCGLVGGGCMADFQNGAIAWSPTTGAHAFTRQDMRLRWATDPGVGGRLGYPVTDTVCGLRGGGCGQHFQGGSIYWAPPMEEPVVIRGPYEKVWAATGWETGRLGYPTSESLCQLRDSGCAQDFEGGWLYGSPASGVHPVYPEILKRWTALGRQRGGLGYPVTDMFCGLRSGGCGQHFQNGSIYWTPRGGAFSVAGILRAEWAASGWENGRLGYPTGNTFCGGLLGSGCGQHFTGGSIYRMGPEPWGTGRVVLDVIRGRWAAQGWEQGPLGYPMGSTFCGLRGGGCGQHFARGSIYWSKATGAHAVSGRALQRWSTQEGWETGRLGYPTGEAWAIPGGTAQSFQGGVVRIVNGRRVS